MEQTELKKETSIDWLMTQLYKKGFIKEIDGNEPIILMNQAKEMEKEQKGYSDEDMINFVEFVSKYYSDDLMENSTIYELLEQFKNK